MSLISPAAVEKMIAETLSVDMNKCLDKAVDDVIDKLKEQVRTKVAARMIALAKSDYNIVYMRNELIIKVKMETN